MFDRLTMRGDHLVDLCSGPEGGHHVVLFLHRRELDIDGAFVSTISGVAGNEDLALHHALRGRNETGEEGDRLLIEEIRKQPVTIAGKNIRDLDAFDPHFDVGEHRGLNATRQSSNRFIRLGVQKHVFHGSATFRAHAVHEISIHGITDAKPEDPGGTGILTDHLDDLTFIADVPIGEEHGDSHRRCRWFTHEMTGDDIETAQAIRGLPVSFKHQVDGLVLHEGQRHRHGHGNPECIVDDQPRSALVSHDRGKRNLHAHPTTVRRKVHQLVHGHPIGVDRFLHQGCGHRLHHLGATLASQIRDECVGFRHVGLGCGPWAFPENMRVTGKGDDVEGVTGSHGRNRLANHFLALVERKTRHGTGGVKHEDQFTRSHRVFFNPGRRREHHRQVSTHRRRVGSSPKVFRIDHHVREDRFLNRFILQLPLKDEVTIGNGLLILQGDLDEAILLRLHDLVQGCVHLGDGHTAGIKRHVDRDVMSGPGGGFHRHRRDSARVGNLIGIRAEPIAAGDLVRPLPDEPPFSEHAVAVGIDDAMIIPVQINDLRGPISVGGVESGHERE